MNNTPCLLVGWSGDVSNKIAQCLKQVLKNVFRNQLEVFFSEEDIGAGKVWPEDLNNKLQRSNFCVLIYTQQNLDSLYLAYEAGAISNRIGQKLVIPLVFGANATDLKGPLMQFQAKLFKYDGIKHTLESINDCLSSKLTEREIETELYFIWPKFKEDIEKILEQYEKSNDGNVRDSKNTADILDDIYLLIQSLSNPISRDIQELVSEIKPLVHQLGTTYSGHYLFIDGEDPAFAALTAATMRAKDYIRSTRFSPMSISGNQDTYGEAIRYKVIGPNPVKQYIRIISANHEEKFKDIEKYLSEFRNHNFDLYLTKKSYPFELVVIDTNEVFVHFHGPEKVIKSSLHIVGLEVAQHFIEFYDQLHDQTQDSDVFKVEFSHMSSDDADRCRDKIMDFFKSVGHSVGTAQDSQPA